MISFSSLIYNSQIYTSRPHIPQNLTLFSNLVDISSSNSSGYPSLNMNKANSQIPLKSWHSLIDITGKGKFIFSAAQAPNRGLILETASQAMHVEHDKLSNSSHHPIFSWSLHCFSTNKLDSGSWCSVSLPWSMVPASHHDIHLHFFQLLIQILPCQKDPFSPHIKLQLYDLNFLSTALFYSLALITT